MVDYINFQRLGSPHNAGVGRQFEETARTFFLTQGLKLEPNVVVPVGISELKKPHRFDLGCQEPPVIVECKSHTWTQGGKMPSAKMTV